MAPVGMHGRHLPEGQGRNLLKPAGQRPLNANTQPPMRFTASGVLPVVRRAFGVQSAIGSASRFGIPCQAVA